MIQVFLKTLSYVGAFLGGILIAYSQGWVTDHFKQKEEKRKKVEEFIGKVTDVVADATASGYKDFPTGAIKGRMNKATAQLERLGQRDMAHTVRNYTNKWTEYNNLVVASDGNVKKFYDEVRAKELRDELDKLTDKILGSKLA